MMACGAREYAGIRGVLIGIVFGLILVSCMAGIAGAAASQDLYFSTTTPAPAFITCPQGYRCLWPAEAANVFTGGFVKYSEAPCARESLIEQMQDKYCYKAQQPAYIPPPVQPQVQIATTGSLSVSSTPSGAAVYVDTQYKGTTPVTISGLAPGYHDLKLSLARYQDKTQSVSVSAGSISALSVSLVPVQRQGASQGSAGAQVGVVPLDEEVGVVSLPEEQPGVVSGKAVGSVDQMNKLNPQPEPPKPADYNKLNPRTDSLKSDSWGFFDPIIGFFLNLIGGKPKEKASIANDNYVPNVRIGESALETFYIESIQPVQVINDNVSLVKGKGTVFRVVVRSTYSSDQFAELKLTLPSDQWSTNVQKYHLPSPIIQGPFRIPAKTSTEIILPFIPDSQRNRYANPRFDNFEDIDNIGKILRGADGTGPDRRVSPDIRIMPAPFLSSNDKQVSYSVEIDPGKKIPGSHASNGVPAKSGSVDVVRTKTYSLFFMNMKSDNVALDSVDYIPVVQESLSEALAIYPIADTLIYATIAADTGQAPCYVNPQPYKDEKKPDTWGADYDCVDSQGNLNHPLFIGCNPYISDQNSCTENNKKCSAHRIGNPNKLCGYSLDRDQFLKPDMSICEKVNDKYECTQEQNSTIKNYYERFMEYGFVADKAREGHYTLGALIDPDAGDNRNGSFVFKGSSIRHWLFAHEFGHKLGLKDTYEESYVTAPPPGETAPVGYKEIDDTQGIYNIWGSPNTPGICAQGPLTGFWVNEYKDITVSKNAKHVMHGPYNVYHHWIVNTSLREFHTLIGQNDCVKWMVRDYNNPDTPNNGYRQLLDTMKVT